MPFELVKYQNCTDFCGINDIENKLCISKYEDDDTNANLMINSIKKDIITINFDKTTLNNNKNIIIKEFGATFTITTTKIQSSSSDPILIFGKCEDILKNYYNIDSNKNLVLFFINYENKYKEIRKLAYEIYYEFYDNNLIELDLNLCNDLLKDNYIINCSSYSIESIINDSCISCKELYYPIFDKNNKFVKCYKDLKGYYLYNNTYYKKCYESCSICDKGGDINNHNCIECAEEYIYQYNISSSYLNCYKNCNYYFYYDEMNDKNYCTNDSNCPEKYKYLISDKKQCINQCYEDSDYKYEYKKKCYRECPNGVNHNSLNKNYFCDSECSKEQPFEIVEFQNCTNFCGINEMFNKSCISKYIDEDRNIVSNLILDNIKTDI